MSPAPVGNQVPFMDGPACSLVSVNASQLYGYVDGQLKVSSRTRVWIDNSQETLFHTIICYTTGAFNVLKLYPRPPLPRFKIP